MYRPNWWVRGRFLVKQNETETPDAAEKRDREFSIYMQPEKTNVVQLNEEF